MSITKLFPNNVKKVTKELRFNKRILQYNLLDMLRFRKLLLLKRRMFLFSVLYEGENVNQDLKAKLRKEQVERIIADTFNYLNTKRVLMAIGYKPKEKVVSHDDEFKLEEDSDSDLYEPGDKVDKIDRRSFRKGGILSRNTSKITIRRAITDKLDQEGDKVSRSNTMIGFGKGIAEHYKVSQLSNASVNIQKELEKVREEDSIKPIPNLGDSENSSEVDLDNEINLITDAYSASKPQKKVLGVIKDAESGKGDSKRSYDITPSEGEFESEEDESEVEEDVSESVDGSRITPHIN